MKFDEQVIKEKRIIEATKKEYQGSTGKFAIICKNLGQEIIDQGSSETNFIIYDDFWGNNNKEIKYLDENTSLSVLGYYFYGLNYSINLEIFYFENEKKIKVKYEGFTVYEEVNGDLECYTPSENWENNIDNLYIIAKKIEDENKIIEKHNKKQAFESKKNSILNYLNIKWGV